MSNIKRRQFLQFASSTLATIGLSQLDFMQQGERYGQVLAQNTPRKLALLIGINDYPDNIGALAGCINDIDMQRELLINRFGFNSKDILTLTDGQATRQNILTSFEEHLINQAKPGDVVVFHFSGHGSRISDKPSCDEIALKVSTQCANSTIMPIDARNQPGSACDIMGHTIFLLMYALKTENVTIILDSCHSGGGKRGNFVIRSYEDSYLLPPCAEEIKYQNQWLEKLSLSPQKFVELRRKSIAKGVVIASAKSDQKALDANFNGFRAGAFSYLFTQYLWQQYSSQSLDTTIINVSRSTNSRALQERFDQDPEVETNLSPQNKNPLIYFLPTQAFPAEAVITKVNGNEVEFWLGGVDSQSLETFNKNASLSIVDSNGKEKGLVTLQSRRGLVGRGKLEGNIASTIKPGTLLQERLRNIPSDLTLKIGLDDELDTNSKAQIKQALQAIPRMEALPLGEQEVQYIFDRMTQTRYRELQKNKVSNLPAVGSWGLFMPSLDDIIPASFGDTKENPDDAIARLKPRLKSLLATKFIKCITGNTNASRIAISASFKIAKTKQPISEAVTLRSLGKPPKNPPSSPTSIQYSSYGVPQLKVGTGVVLEVKNNESRPLYISILVVDAQGEMGLIFPVKWSDGENSALVKAGEPISTGTLEVQKPFGTSEVLIIASTTPLRESLKILGRIAEIQANPSSKRSAESQSDDFLNLTNSLRDDLEVTTRSTTTTEGIALPAGTSGVDTKKLAAMAIAFEVVN
jgi:Caspase domain/Domain of unknown function (DUF4384)